MKMNRQQIQTLVSQIPSAEQTKLPAMRTELEAAHGGYTAADKYEVRPLIEAAIHEIEGRQQTLARDRDLAKAAPAEPSLRLVSGAAPTDRPASDSAEVPAFDGQAVQDILAKKVKRPSAAVSYAQRIAKEAEGQPHEAEAMALVEPYLVYGEGALEGLEDPVHPAPAGSEPAKDAPPAWAAGRFQAPAPDADAGEPQVAGASASAAGVVIEFDSGVGIAPQGAGTTVMGRAPADMKWSRLAEVENKGQWEIVTQPEVGQKFGEGSPVMLVVINAGKSPSRFRALGAGRAL